MKIAKIYLERVEDDYKKSRRIVQVMMEGGPASLLQLAAGPSTA
jgi:hypothetical protein